jgi:hypothetical protein
MGSAPRIRVRRWLVKPFLTDDAIVRRLEEIEKALRAIADGRGDRTAVGQAADDLHRLAMDLMPEAPR